jgi:hypothetical protein
MGSNPLNLALRLLLELAALFSFSRWGWSWSPRLLAIALMVALPAIAATIWGVFAVPNDPSRSGKAPVKVPGIVRLGIELIILTAAATCLFDLYEFFIGLVFSGITLLHYILSFDRIGWLVRQK